jgi:acyl carrier protein
MRPGHQDLRDDLERLVRAHAKIELPGVADDDVLGHELGLDSQALLGLLLDVEDAHAIEIAPDEVAGLAGIRFADFVRLVDAAVRTTGAERQARS